ncbi:MAG: Jag N-terminal domain-containing protein [Actinomycetota bacterium]
METTAKTVDDAKAEALDQLGVAADEAEFDVLEEPRPGLFGRVRGTARVRARVRPTPVRPKNDRRRSSKRGGGKKLAESRSSNRSDRGGQRSESPAASPASDISPETADVDGAAAPAAAVADGSGSTN